MNPQNIEKKYTIVTFLIKCHKNNRKSTLNWDLKT